MKQLFILVYLTIGFAFAQNDLVNTYSFYSEIYGGTEDSGIQRTECYLFVAGCTLQTTVILFEGNEITLKKGDTLQVSVNSFIPYGNPNLILDSLAAAQPLIPALTEDFTVYKYGNMYFVQVDYPAFWNGEIEYRKQKKKYTAKIKEGFDTGYTYAAP